MASIQIILISVYSFRKKEDSITVIKLHVLVFLKETFTCPVVAVIHNHQQRCHGFVGRL